jgi:hypothetical protein
MSAEPARDIHQAKHGIPFRGFIVDDVEALATPDEGRVSV